MERFLSRDARNFRPSAIRAFAKLINDPNVISFAGGVPSPETFPAERIAEILDAHDLRARMSANNRQLAERFSAPAVAREYLEIYERLSLRS